MIATHIRPGMIILFEGSPCRVLDCHLYTPANLPAWVQAKLRNLKNGATIEHRFVATEIVERSTV